MKIIYVNILGKWIELDKNAIIQNTNAYVWIQENNLHDHIFINIGLSNKTYKVHVSQIMIETVSFN